MKLVWEWGYITDSCFNSCVMDSWRNTVSPLTVVQSFVLEFGPSSFVHWTKPRLLFDTKSHFAKALMTKRKLTVTSPFCFSWCHRAQQTCMTCKRSLSFFRFTTSHLFSSPPVYSVSWSRSCTKTHWLDGTHISLLIIAAASSCGYHIQLTH